MRGPNGGMKAQKPPKSPAAVSGGDSLFAKGQGDGPPAECHRLPKGAFSFALNRTPAYRRASSGKIISSRMATKPYFSYSGRPMSVASREMKETPRSRQSRTSRSSTW